MKGLAANGTTASGLCQLLNCFLALVQFGRVDNFQRYDYNDDNNFPFNNLAQGSSLGKRSPAILLMVAAGAKC
jgi:hypothetical protein